MLAEGGFAILLVVAGSFAASGFSAMVDYMTPVYWFFIVLSMGALMILRRRFPDAERPVRCARTSRVGQPVRVPSLAFSANAMSHSLRASGPW